MTQMFSMVGLDELRNKIKKIAQDSPAAFKNDVKIAVVNIDREAKKAAPVNDGILRASGHWTLYADGLTGINEFNAAYAAYVEFGTAPHMPPAAALAEWAANHGMPGAEFAIARKIAKDGTKPQPFLFPAWADEKREFLDRIKVTSNRLIGG